MNTKIIVFAFGGVLFSSLYASQNIITTIKHNAESRNDS